MKLEWMDGWNELVRWGGLVSNRERGKDLKVSFFILFFFSNFFQTQIWLPLMSVCC